MPSSRSITMSCPRWCISCSFVPSSISNRDVEAPPRWRKWGQIYFSAGRLLDEAAESSLYPTDVESDVGRDATRVSPR
jgi:hypothetical protein